MPSSYDIIICHFFLFLRKAMSLFRFLLTIFHFSWKCNIFTENIDLQLQQQRYDHHLTSSFDIIIWHHHVTSSYDIIIWHHHVISSYYDAIWWCHMMMAYDDVIWWCHMMTSYDDVIWWCHMMMSYDDHTFVVVVGDRHFS